VTESQQHKEERERQRETEKQRDREITYTQVATGDERALELACVVGLVCDELDGFRAPLDGLHTRAQEKVEF
jgi:hypothetical protein